MPKRIDCEKMPKNFTLFLDEIPKNRFHHFHESFELLMALPIYKEENNHKFDIKNNFNLLFIFYSFKQMSMQITALHFFLIIKFADHTIR